MDASDDTSKKVWDALKVKFDKAPVAVLSSRIELSLSEGDMPKSHFDQCSTGDCWLTLKSFVCSQCLYVCIQVQHFLSNF